MCSEAVLKYLQQTNRPYSANDILLNLHKAHTKAAIQKSLDELVEKGVIRVKEYGKQKIYCVIQESNGEGSNEDVTELDELIDKKSKELQKLEQELKSLGAQVKELQSQPTTAQAKADNERLKKTNTILREKLNQLKSGVSPVSKEEWKKTEEILLKVTKESKKRDRWVKEMTDVVLENSNYTKDQLYDEIGIEINNLPPGKRSPPALQVPDSKKFKL